MLSGGLLKPPDISSSTQNYKGINMHATSIKAEDSEGKYFSAEINGETKSGITEKSRFWTSVQKAIEEGAEVEPYVEQVKSIQDQLAQTDRELMKIAARTIEDVIQDRIDSGKFVAHDVQEKITERKALRAKL